MLLRSDLKSGYRQLVDLAIARFGLTRAIFYGVLSKVWLAGAGLVTIIFIATYFSPEVQGYYFTFNSLLAMQVFVELGLGTVVIHFTSHEWARLKLDDQGRIVGDPDALSRLQSIARISTRWYAIGAVALTIVLSVVGSIFFASSDQGSVHWQAPWIALCVFTGLNLCLMPLFSLLEGCNQVADVYFCRFIHGIVMFTATWIIMLAGGNLWTQVGAAGVPFLWNSGYLLIKFGSNFKMVLSPGSGPRVNWWREAWPMHWRVAVTWLSGFFFFSLFTPVLFHFKGAVAAGQMGMTWRMVNTISMIASMWITTRAPRFGVLIARGQRTELDRLLARSVVVAVVVALLGMLCVVAFVYAVNWLQPAFGERFLTLSPTLFLGCALILFQINYGQATYLRSHKTEPFVGLAVSSAILMALLVWIAGKSWGAMGIAISFCAVMTFYNLPYGTYIFMRFKKQRGV